MFLSIFPHSSWLTPRAPRSLQPIFLSCGGNQLLLPPTQSSIDFRTHNLLRSSRIIFHHSRHDVLTLPYCIRMHSLPVRGLATDPTDRRRWRVGVRREVDHNMLSNNEICSDEKRRSQAGGFMLSWNCSHHFTHICGHDGVGGNDYGVQLVRRREGGVYLCVVVEVWLAENWAEGRKPLSIIETREREQVPSLLFFIIML